jgi:hypothetical protein
MLKFLKVLTLSSLVYLMPATSSASTCYGKVNCQACSTCNYCKHCAKGGGTCGVCGSVLEREVVSETSSDTLAGRNPGGIKKNLGATLLIGTGIAGAAYYIAKSNKKK